VGRQRWICFSALTLAACVEQVVVNDGALGPGQRCAQICTAWEGCSGREVSATCVDNCVGRLTRFSASAGAKFTACMASACNADENACILSLPILAEHARYAEECRRKLAECGDAHIETTCDIATNPWAARHRLFDAKTMSDALACLRRPCGETCLLALPAYPILRSD
jgi:hypothetical protein